MARCPGPRSEKMLGTKGVPATNSFCVSDRNIAYLLQSGSTHRKNERYCHTLKAVQQNKHFIIDKNYQDIVLDLQPSSIAVTVFWTALEVNSKPLTKYFPNLVEELKLPLFLLANTYARLTSSNVHFGSALEKEPTKKMKFDTDLAN